MPEVEKNKRKSLDVEAPKGTLKEKSKESPASATPKKSVWDLPDGEYSEVIDSEGHRNRINHY